MKWDEKCKFYVLYFSCSFCLNIFKLSSFLWLCIQQALGCQKQVRCLRVTINLSRKFKKEIGATPIFKRILVLFEYIYNPLMILHPTSPWFWKSHQVLESQCPFSIFGPNDPSKEKECHAHFLWNYYFMLKFLQSSWFSIQQALDFENGIRYFKVAMNCPFLAQMSQTRK